jgi:hypothetical protein
MDLPILGQSGPSGPNGGAQAAAIHRTYAVALRTTDGDEHILTLKFGLETGPDGVVKLDGLRDFNPEMTAMANVIRTLRAAQLGLLLDSADKFPPVAVEVEGPAIVVWRHVTSAEYLGEWDPELKQLVVRTESHEREHGKKAA